MLNPWSLILVALLYVALLFAIAWVGDKKRIARDHQTIQAIIYSLTLGVYCTSWTFYGAVGSAATTGWGFLPIYLGPMLVMLLGFDVIRRIAEVSRDQRITSIADYIAFRYGRSHTIAILVTVAAFVGSIPYIALQLKGITTGIDVISSSAGSKESLGDNISLYLALALAVFSILFGTRTMDASEHHRGLMWAIAFESMVKLLAFLAIGIFVIFGVFKGFQGITETLNNEEYRQLFTPWQLPEGFGIQMVLAMAAILCLPRQFHVTIVEFRSTRDLRVARWLFPCYLLIFAALVMPIALAGLTQFTGQGVNPDTYVLSLPIAFDQEALAVLAFLGGFSAATGMVIVATVALAIMVSNDIVMPLLLRSGLAQRRGNADLSDTLLWVRRFSILAITLFAYFYYQAIEAGVPLASIGLLSFSAVAQFAPAMLIGLYWRGASRMGAIAGLLAGVVSWFFLLLLPSLQETNAIADLLPSLTFNQGAAWTLIVNTLTLVLVSLWLPDSKATSVSDSGNGSKSGLITIGELQSIIGRFLGIDDTRKALQTHLGSTELDPGSLANPATLQFGERLLAGSIGSASARTVLTTALHRQGLGPSAVLDLLNRTSEAVQFNRELLESTLNNMSQGVSVVDNDLRLVGWNRRYLELLAYPEGAVHLGQPIQQLIRLNAERGLLGDDDIESEVRKRIQHLRNREAYRQERIWLDGKVIEIQGNPIPGGGYVTTYSDITHFKNIQAELQEINETLEQRVEQRTGELRTALQEVESSRQTAEMANRSKTRFLAAASHDLLQPMNAARLFVSILRQREEDGDSDRLRLVKRVDRSLAAAEELLGALLDISKLDSGMLKPELEAISLPDLFEQLRRNFKGLAANRNLELRVRPVDQHILSDRNLLYRIIQNFLANAIRYTENGGVLLGSRLAGDAVRISVWDTGVGIDESELESIFQEFQRLDYAEGLDEKGLGLGLAICDRIGRMLGHEIAVKSSTGHGSCFSVLVPLAPATMIPKQGQPGISNRESLRLEELLVLCVDNEADILDGMKLLLERWGCKVILAESQEQATQQVQLHGQPDIVLVDYHLHGQQNGLAVMQHLDALLETKLAAIVITADRSDELEERARNAGYSLLRKPIKPAALRALITNTLKARG